MPQIRAGMNRFPGGWRPRPVHPIRAADTRRKREPARQRFPQANQVRHRIRVLAREPLARASEPGINLVQNEQRLMLVAEAPQQRKKCFRRYIDASPHLNGLDQHRANFAGAEKLTELALKLVERPEPE